MAIEPVHRSKDRNQDIRGQKLAYVLHRYGVTAEMFYTRDISAETIRLAESIAGLSTPASEETLAMCVKFLRTMEEFDKTLELDGFDGPERRKPTDDDLLNDLYGQIDALNNARDMALAKWHEAQRVERAAERELDKCINDLGILHEQEATLLRKINHLTGSLSGSLPGSLR